MRIGVIGGGAWGTALAQTAAGDGADVLLWAREAEVVEAVNGSHANPLFLPGIALSPGIKATGTLADMADTDALLVVTPAQHLRGVLSQLPQLSIPLVLCAKGIEAGSRQLMSEVAAEVQPSAPIAVLFVRQIHRIEPGPEYNLFLAQAAKLHLAFGVLWTIAVAVHLNLTR